MIWDNFAIKKLRHTRVHAARSFADVAQRNGVRNSRDFYVFGP